MKRLIATIATISMCFVIFPTAPSSNAIAQKGLDLCIQDDSGTPILRINSTTGQYVFDDCDGLFLAGTASVSKAFGTLGLGFTNGDYKAQFSINTVNTSATGFVRNRATGQTVCTVNDTNYAKGNTCSCP